jgi:hypothetical protein
MQSIVPGASRGGFTFGSPRTQYVPTFPAIVLNEPIERFIESITYVLSTRGMEPSPARLTTFSRQRVCEMGNFGQQRPKKRQHDERQAKH